MKKRFTADTRLWHVTHCRSFAPLRKYILSPRQFRFGMQFYKIKNLQWFYPADSQRIAETLNAMRERTEKGQKLFYDFGHDTGLFAFTVGDNKPFVLILPGGGYGDVCSLIEGFPVALQLNRMGYNAFVGLYRIAGQAHYPNPQDDVAKMLSFIFENAPALGVNAQNYAVCGFSAGGHLAASWGTKSLGYAKYGLPRPAAVILAYPVITMGEYTHKGSRKNLLGKDANNQVVIEQYSIEKQIDADYPPAFIWQCKNDRVVPFQNSLLLKKALDANGVPCRLMPVEGTAHGWGLANGTAAEGWLQKAVAFWQTTGGKA